MKKKLPANLVKFRVHLPGYENRTGDDIEGAFIIPYAYHQLKVVCGVGKGWDHVSVSLSNRAPTWHEMNRIRNLFFEPDETVIQIHPPKNQYINYHPNALHLWRCWDQKIKLPPTWMIAPDKR